MYKFLLHSLSTILLIFILSSCSASTGTRYETKEIKETKNQVSENKEQEMLVEDFDITPFKTELEIEEIPSQDNIPPNEIWYEYSDTVSNSSRNIAGTADGYRVQVLSTDNMDEANEVRAQIYFNTMNKEVYITFEPPFYKVKAGDFISFSEAEDFKFKLNQLGYPEARVIQETVNIFE